MMDTELIRKEYLDINFYLRSMSLFLRSSCGIEDRCRLLFGILTNVIDTQEQFFKRLDIYNENYFDNVNPSSTNDEILDMIASIIGIKRTVFLNDNWVTLSNKDLLYYIQATVAKNIYDGTNLSIKEAYYGSPLTNWNRYYEKYSSDDTIKKYLESIKTKGSLKDLHINYATEKTDDGTTESHSLNVYLLYQKDEGITNNINKLFFNHYLTIESIGISYDTSVSKTWTAAEWGTAKYYEETEQEVYYYQ